MSRFAWLVAPSVLLALAPIGCDGDDATGAGGGTTSSSSGEGGSGSGGTPLVNPSVCNPIDDDCVEPGTRCAVTFNDDQQLPPTCIPVEGDDGLGERCERPTDEAGVDTCAPGLYCGYWGQPQGDPQARSCLAFCSEDDPCAEGSSCLYMLGGPYGACLPNCDPFADTCGDGLTCSWFNDRGGSGLTACHFGGDGVEGDTCDFEGSGADSCVDGTTCLGVNGVQQCRAFCDVQHPCTGDAACSLFPGVEPTGWCAPYELACVGSVTWDTATVSSITLELDVTEPFVPGSIPVTGATVKACGRTDLDCATPLAEGTSNATGELSLTIAIGPEGFDGYFEVDAGSPILSHIARPIVADTGVGLSGASAMWLARVQETESPLDPARGHVLTVLESCNGGFGSGATFSVDTGDASTSAQYWGPGRMRPDLTYTDWRGQGLLLDVPPGMATLTAQIADGPVLGTTEIPVRAGAVTLVAMEPTP